MATNTYKIGGQHKIVTPSTYETVYTVPAATQAVMTIVICESGGADATFRLALAINGAADTIAQSIYYDATLKANDTLILSGVSLGAGDLIRGYASTTNVVFSCNGCEIT